MYYVYLTESKNQKISGKGKIHGDIECLANQLFYIFLFFKKIFYTVKMYEKIYFVLGNMTIICDANNFLRFIYCKIFLSKIQWPKIV